MADTPSPGSGLRLALRLRKLVGGGVAGVSMAVFLPAHLVMSSGRRRDPRRPAGRPPAAGR